MSFTEKRNLARMLKIPFGYYVLNIVSVLKPNVEWLESNTCFQCD